MSDERCKHKVFLTHRCRDCEQEITKEEVRIFHLEEEVKNLKEILQTLAEQLMIKLIGPDGEINYCTLCQQEQDSNGTYQHEAECLVKKAKELI